MAWGVGYLTEAAIRVAIVATTSTGIALISSKLVPYAFAIALSGWTLVYGEHEKKKAERLASTVPVRVPAPPSAPGHDRLPR